MRDGNEVLIPGFAENQGSVGVAPGTRPPRRQGDDLMRAGPGHRRNAVAVEYRIPLRVVSAAERERDRPDEGRAGEQCDAREGERPRAYPSPPDRRLGPLGGAPRAARADG